MPYGNGNLQLAIPTSRYSNGNLQLAIPTSRYSNIVTVTCYCNYIDEDSSCKEEKVEDFILKPEKNMETKKLWAASLLSLSIFWAKKKKI